MEILSCIDIIINYTLVDWSASQVESIEVRNGKLYRDDRQVNKFYAKNRDINNFAIRDLHDSDGDIILPNSYFILNDNGDKQSDSRTYGLIDKDDIVEMLV